MRPPRAVAVLGALACLLGVPAISAALTNPSFEDNGGSYDGWTVIDPVETPDDLLGFHNPPATTDVCGHGVSAPDGTHFAGVTHLAGVLPKPGLASFMQAVTVQNHVPGSPRTRFELDIWVNMAHNKDANDNGRTNQHYLVGWDNDGQTPDDITSTERSFEFGYISHLVLMNGGKSVEGDDPNMEWHGWRRVRMHGTIPGDPQVVVLRIDLETRDDAQNDPSTTTSHNVFDNVSFVAESVAASDGPFTGDLSVNHNFERSPFNTKFPESMPRYWSGYGSAGEDGPAYGYTNGGGGEWDPLGVSTTEGTHFFGRAKPYDSPNQFHVWMGAQTPIPVREWDACATGLRYRLYYLSVCSEETRAHPIPPPTNRSHQQWDVRWRGDGTEPSSHGENIPWIRMADTDSRTTGGEASSFTEIETGGEMTCYNSDAQPFAPSKVIINGHVLAFRTYEDNPNHVPPDEGDETYDFIFRTLVDNVDFYVEAIIDKDFWPLFRTSSPLPEHTCQQSATSYEVQMEGCGEGTLTFSIVDGSLPPGLQMSSSGLISGVPTAGGEYQFTVQIADDVRTATKVYTLNVIGPCCNYPAADYDADTDVDQMDFSLWQLCVTGPAPAEGVPAGCECADLNGDLTAVDSSDFVVFQGCTSGPDVAANPDCVPPVPPPPAE